MELTAASTVPDSHRIPFFTGKYSRHLFGVKVNKNKQNRYNSYTLFYDHEGHCKEVWTLEDRDISFSFFSIEFIDFIFKTSFPVIDRLYSILLDKYGYSRIGETIDGIKNLLYQYILMKSVFLILFSIITNQWKFRDFLNYVNRIST